MSGSAAERATPLVSAPSQERISTLKLASDMVWLALPIFIGRVSWVVMKVTDTALLGHAGTRYLEAASLSDLWTSSTGVFVMSRSTMTLMAQAWGAGNKELVGVWFQVALAVFLPVCVLVGVTWCLTGPVLRMVGKDDPELVGDAAYYAFVLMLCLPVRVIFAQLGCFFNCQRIMRPNAVCSTFAMTFNLLIGLPFVLGFPIPGWEGFGFKACPWVTTVMEYAQLLLVYVVFLSIMKLGQECWAGWDAKAITRERVFVFMGQYIPSSLSLGSDFWRVAVIGAVADSLGDVNLAVWNSSYRVCWILLTFLGSLAGGMSIILGNSLGKGQASESKRVAMIGLSVCLAMAGSLSLVVVLIPRTFGAIFSTDDEVLDLFEECKWPMAAFVLTMNVGTMMESIPAAAGRMKTGFYAGLIGSWVGQVPCVFLCTRYWRNDLYGLYAGAAFGYALLVLLLGIAIYTMDWDEVVAEAKARSEVKSKEQTATESSLQPVPGKVEGKKEKVLS